MTTRELFDFITDVSIGDEDVDEYLEKVKTKSCNTNIVSHSVWTGVQLVFVKGLILLYTKDAGNSEWTARIDGHRTCR